MSAVKNRPAKAKPKKRNRAAIAPARPRAGLLRRAAPGVVAAALAIGVGAFAVVGSNPNITGAVPAADRQGSMPSRPAPELTDAPVPAIGVPFFAKGAHKYDLAAVTITKASYQGTGASRLLVLDVRWSAAAGTTDPSPGFFKVSTAAGAPAPMHPLEKGQLPSVPVESGSPDVIGQLAYTVGQGDATVTVVPAFGETTTFPVHG